MTTKQKNEEFLKEGCDKPNAPIQTKNFGEIRRDVYKATVEILVLKEIINKKINEFNLPFSLELTTYDNGFFKDCYNRHKDKTSDGLTDEQLLFEFKKTVLLQDAVDSVDTISYRYG